MTVNMAVGHVSESSNSSALKHCFHLLQIHYKFLVKLEHCVVGGLEYCNFISKFKGVGPNQLIWGASDGIAVNQRNLLLLPVWCSSIH